MKELFGRYLIDEYGNITSKISVDRETGKQKIIKPFYDKDGYKRISLVTDEGRKKFRICRLVALSYIENLENKPFVNHKDGNKKNDYVENLEWVTASENTRHAIESGIDTRKRWTYMIYENGKFVSEAQTYAECGEIIGCGKSSVSDAVNKEKPVFGKFTIKQTYNYE